MPIMNEAMPRDEWEKLQRGEKIEKIEVTPRPEPKEPEVENRIRRNEIPLAEFEGIAEAKVKRVRNKDGVNFIGYDVVVLQKGGKVREGWMIEADYERLRRRR